jgi:choline dehydrogenase
MNVLVRGVRFSMRIGRTERAKGILAPKADSADKKDFFYMGDADPDRVRTTITSHHFLFLP